MTFNLNSNQTVSVIGSPVTASGSASEATLSNTVYTSSDPTVFTVAPDPNTAGGAIITATYTGTGMGTAVLTETAVATEPGGLITETITGTANIDVTAIAPPPPPPGGVAASLVFTFGTPETTAQPAS